MKFEVGKEYHKAEEKNSFRAKCIWADHLSAVLEITFNSRPVAEVTNVGARVHWLQKNAEYWVEYKEPIKIVRYINVYPTWVSSGYESRSMADSRSDYTRIACKRIEFTEGEYDE